MPNLILPLSYATVPGVIVLWDLGGEIPGTDSAYRSERGLKY
jgi:hypothetical protein